MPVRPVGSTGAVEKSVWERLCRSLGLGKNVGTLDADVVYEVDERLNGGFSLVHCGCGDGNVAHFPARSGGAFAVEVDTRVWYGEGTFGYFEMGVGRRTTQYVKHNCWLSEFKALYGDG